MSLSFNQLRARQLDRSLLAFGEARDVARPSRGWIRAMREAAGLSAAGVARTLGTSRQLPLQLEKAEVAETISLATLRRVAHAMDCELVYALVPRTGTVEQLQQRKAARDAAANVLRVEHSMALEDQAAGHLDEAVKAETARLLRHRKPRKPN